MSAGAPGAVGAGWGLKVTYTYDTGSAGDLYQRTFPKPSATSGTVTATYSWDAMHRRTYVSFSDSSNPYGYNYDSNTIWGTALTNTKGHMVLANHSAVAASLFSYDVVEQDPKKLMELVREINQLLEQKQRRLGNLPSPEASD
jgi:hypothetical protein